MSHGWYVLAPFDWDDKAKVLRHPEAIGRDIFDLEIAFRRGALDVRGAPDSPELRKRLTRMFQLGLDTTEFIALAAESDAHRWVVDAGFGRLLCGSTLFEDAVKVIATTNTTWNQTKRMVQLLVEKCGRRSPAGFAAFPSPKDVARFSAEVLQQECRLGYRAKSIHGLAKAIVSGDIDLEAISEPAQTTDGLFLSFKTLPGIGPYGAAHLLAMDGRHDFIAVDTEFRRFVREKYHRGRRVADKTMLRRYKRWGRWKYLAYWSELWRGNG